MKRVADGIDMIAAMAAWAGSTLSDGDLRAHILEHGASLTERETHDVLKVPGKMATYLAERSGNESLFNMIDAKVWVQQEGRGYWFQYQKDVLELTPQPDPGAEPVQITQTVSGK